MSGGILKKLNIVLGADTTDLETKMRKAATNLRKEGRNFGQIGSELSLAVSLPLLGIGASAIKAAGDMESFRMGFNTTMKAAGRSAEDATKELAALREVAKMPGIDFEGAIKGSMRLQGVGMNAEKARKIIAELANGISMAGGTAQDLDGVSRQLAQMAGKGKVMQQDLNIMLENMPMLAKVLKDTFGATTADGLRDMGVNAEQFIDGITEGLAKLERVPGGLQNSMVNFGVEVKLALGTVGEAINKAFNVTGKLESFATWIGATATGFANLSEGTQKAIITVLGVTAAIGPAIKAYSIWNNTKAAAIDLANKAVGAYSSLKGAVLAATEKFMAMDKVTKATTIGLVVAAIGLAVVAFQSLTAKMSEAEKVQATLNSVNIEAAKSIAAERLEAEQLVGVVNDETKSKEKKATALKRLREINADYFGDLDLEKSKTEDVTAALGNYIKFIEKRARLAAANQKLVEIEKELLDTDQQFENAKPSYLQMAGNALLNYGNATGVVNANVADFTDNLAENKKALEAQKAALLGILNEGGGPVASSGTSTFTATGASGGGSKKATSETKEQIDVMADLAKSYGEVDAKAAALGNTYDDVSEKTNLIRDAIVQLIDQGVSPQDERLVMLSERYKNLTSDLSSLSTQYESTTGTMAKATEEMTVKVSDMAEKTKTAMDTLRKTVGEAAMGAAQNMWDLAAAGETSFKKLGKAALKGAADQVRAAIMSGVSSAVQKALITVPFPFNIAAGVAAGAAAGVLFNKALSALKIPAFAEGGKVTKPTLALIGEAGPEFVVPEKKLPGLAAMHGLTRSSGGGNVHITGQFEVSGEKLLLVLDRAAQSQFRSFGR